VDPELYRTRKPSPEEQVDGLALFALADEPVDSENPLWLVAPETEIEKAFALWHRDHPAVYAALEAAALSQQRDGAHRLGIAKLVEDIRYNPGIRPRDGEAFRLNNNYRSLYARLLVHRHPSLAPLFVLRERTEKGAA
jgi:hypothetical protein